LQKEAAVKVSLLATKKKKEKIYPGANVIKILQP
jgi:hypothetical protein